MGWGDPSSFPFAVGRVGLGNGLAVEAECGGSEGENSQFCAHNFCLLNSSPSAYLKKLSRRPYGMAKCDLNQGNLNDEPECLLCFWVFALLAPVCI